MRPYGAIIRLIEAIPSQLLREPSATRPDLALIADKLGHCERQIRALAELAPAPEAVIRQPGRVKSERAAA